MKERVKELNERLAGASPESILDFFLSGYGNRVALSTSLSLEDQVLTDMLCRLTSTPRIFTLDTGRLFPETYSLIDRTNMRYGIKIEVFFPDHRHLEPFVNAHGINCCYQSIDLRRECCRIRKIEPLRRAFTGLDAWICGLRREQSVTRTDMNVVEWDENNGLIKVNPLINWTGQQLRNYISLNGVPYNKLHDQGFPSIGCQPCTRAVGDGEDPRAGRWWWESPEHKECGLHKR